ETLLFIDALSGSATFEPGTYTQTQGNVPGQVDLGISRLDGTCTSTGQDYGAESGTVIITSVTATGVAGTFNITLMAGAGTLEGSFNVPLCQSLPSGNCVP